MIWEIDPKAGGPAQRHRQSGSKGGRPTDPRNRPRSRGRSDLMGTCLGGLEGKARDQRSQDRTPWCSTPSPSRAGYRRTDEAPAPDRTARWWDAYMARPRAWIIWLASRSRPVLWRKIAGGAFPPAVVQSVALRLVCDRETRDREIYPRANTGRWSRPWTTPRGDAIRKRGWSGPTARRFQRLDIGTRRRGRRFQEGDRSRQLHGLHRRSQARAAAIRRPPFTTSDAAGRKPAARWALRPRHTMRDRAAGFTRGIDNRRRDHRSSLRICEPTACRSTISAITQGAQGDRRGLWQRLCAGRRRASTRPRPRTRRKRTKPSARRILSRRPAEMRRRLDTDQARLYELIWIRTIASQMESAELERTTVDIAGQGGLPRAGFARHHRSGGEVPTAFLALYQEGRDDDGDDDDSPPPPRHERRRSAQAQGTGRHPALHRAGRRVFSEASLVKRMEELGIGRPSTYASILQVLKDRGYVRLEKEASAWRRQGPRRGRVSLGKLFRPLRRV